MILYFGEAGNPSRCARCVEAERAWARASRTYKCNHGIPRVHCASSDGFSAAEGVSLGQSLLQLLLLIRG